MRTWAKTHAPDVNLDYETAQFVDYWQAKSGKDASKLDWRLTWQTWMRRAQQSAGRRSAGSPRANNTWRPYMNPDNPDTAYSGYKLEGSPSDAA
jgi:hypothetical protein